MIQALGSSLCFLKSQGTTTGSVHFSELSYSDGRRTTNRKMHQINPRIRDVFLPAVVTCATSLKFIERDLPDETNYFGFIGSNGIQRALYARLLFTSGQFCHVYRGPVH